MAITIAAPLSQATGYGIVVGLGVTFALGKLFIWETSAWHANLTFILQEWF